MLARLRQRVLARVQRSALLAAAALQHDSPLPDLEGTVEVETTFACLLLDEQDEWITPTLLATGGWEPGVTALLGARIRSDPAALLGYYRSLGFELRLQLPDEKGAQELSDADLLARAEEAEYVNLVLERPRPGRAGQAR